MPTDESQHPEKKIIVDEDWKSRVEAEREAVRQDPQPSDSAASESDEPLPPPSLTYLAGTLYLQGAIALGLLPHPVSGKSELRLAHAKHTIDTLEILFEKTVGNRTVEESDQIDGMLHQLRLAYVELKARVAQSTPPSTATS